MEWEEYYRSVKFGLLHFARCWPREMEQSKFYLAIIFLPFHSEPLNICILSWANFIELDTHMLSTEKLCLVANIGHHYQPNCHVIYIALGRFSAKFH